MTNDQTPTPQVSVIVPCHNVARFLRKCLKSIVRQTLHNIEILPVNDGSTDGTLAIMEEFAARDSRVRIVNMPENRGVQWARHEGIKAAKGEWIMFVDGDDYIDRNFVEAMFHAAEKNHADAASCSSHWIAQMRFNLFKHKGPKVAQELIGRTIDNEELMRYLPSLMSYDVIHPEVWAYIYNRVLFENYNPPVTTCPRGQDRILNFEVLRKARRVTFANICGYHYRHGGMSTKHANMMERYWTLYREFCRIAQEERTITASLRAHAASGLACSFHRWIQELMIRGKGNSELRSPILAELELPEWQEVFAHLNDDRSEMAKLVIEGDADKIIAFNRRMIPSPLKLWLYRMINR